MLKSPRDFIIVKIDKAFQDEIVTPSGVKLYKDTSLTPEWDATCTGEVVSVPYALSKKPSLRGLSLEVEEGDTIFFSYIVVFSGDPRNRDSFAHDNIIYYEGQYYWKVNYMNYLGKLAGGKIVPAQGYAFIEELKPVTTERIGLIWMPEMTKHVKHKGKGVITGLGRPKEGEPTLAIADGDVVRYNENYARKYEVNGKRFIVMPQHLLLGKEEYTHDY